MWRSRNSCQQSAVSSQQSALFAQTEDKVHRSADLQIGCSAGLQAHADPDVDRDVAVGVDADGTAELELGATQRPLCPVAVVAAGFTNLASSIGALSLTSSIFMVKAPLGRAMVQRVGVFTPPKSR